jgi:hypothetical protein
MQLPFTILASGDSWIGLLIFIIIAVVSSLSKKMQQGQEPEMPEDWPRPQPPRPAPPPHQPPVIAQRPAAPKPQPSRRSLTEEQVQEVLRRMRRPAHTQVPSAPPPIVVTVEEAPRRLVQLSREESELPSARPETKAREVEPTPHEEAPSTAPAPARVGPVAVSSPRTSLYRDLLARRKELRRAIVLREILGPPLALRRDG